MVSSLRLCQFHPSTLKNFAMLFAQDVLSTCNVLYQTLENVYA